MVRNSEEDKAPRSAGGLPSRGHCTSSQNTVAFHSNAQQISKCAQHCRNMSQHVEACRNLSNLSKRVETYAQRGCERIQRARDDSQRREMSRGLMATRSINETADSAGRKLAWGRRAGGHRGRAGLTRNRRGDARGQRAQENKQQSIMCHWQATRLS